MVPQRAPEGHGAAWAAPAQTASAETATTSSASRLGVGRPLMGGPYARDGTACKAYRSGASGPFTPEPASGCQANCRASHAGGRWFETSRAHHRGLSLRAIAESVERDADYVFGLPGLAG